MDAEYISDRLPDKLVECLQASHHLRKFRRRAVLTNGNNRWELVCCTVEGFLPGESVPELTPSRQYRQALLYEDILSGEECLNFATELQERRARFGEINLQRGQNPQWTTELKSVNNDYMIRAGYVIGLRFGQPGVRSSVRTLLSADQPYYPDINDAARDWLPFPEYHGDSDGRNDQIFFLLPETRAFIANAAFSQKGTLDITVAGTEINDLSLLIKGAYWEEKSIRHFEGSVNDLKAELVVPADTDRLEYYLIDHEGVIYDFHREDRFSRLRPNGNTLGSVKRKLADQIRDAAYYGEGLRVEFKPFVEPEQRLHGSDGQKSKLLEIVTTVVAFANTDGGRIYLGVDDDCRITGIDEKLCKWAKSSSDEATVNRYLGALKSKIKDNVHGEVRLSLSHVEVDGVLVAVVEVEPAAPKPVTILQDQYLYMRMGASNRKVPPDQWKSTLLSNRPGGFDLSDRF